MTDNMGGRGYLQDSLRLAMCELLELSDENMEIHETFPSALENFHNESKTKACALNISAWTIIVGKVWNCNQSTECRVLIGTLPNCNYRQSTELLWMPLTPCNGIKRGPSMDRPQPSCSTRQSSWAPPTKTISLVAKSPPL